MSVSNDISVLINIMFVILRAVKKTHLAATPGEVEGKRSRETPAF